MRATIIVLLILTAAGAAFGQGYKIDWYSINSGGGLVTGGGYNLNSTIGQPAATRATCTVCTSWASSRWKWR